MADGVWNRQGVNLYPSSTLSASLLKRPRTEYESLSSGLGSQGLQSYSTQNSNQSAYRGVTDTGSIDSAYDRYLQGVQANQNSSYASGGASNLAAAGLGRSMVGGISGIPLAESLARGLPRPGGSDLLQNGQGIGRHVPVDMVSRRGGNESISLPPDASKTLYIEGLPRDATRREVAHIFRPFVGYKEVRLIFKEGKLRGDPLIMCFVDFADPACAATAMTALQGYEMDEHNPESSFLRIQFSRHGPRSSGGSRGRR